MLHPILSSHSLFPSHPSSSFWSHSPFSLPTPPSSHFFTTLSLSCCPLPSPPRALQTVCLFRNSPSWSTPLLSPSPHGWIWVSSAPFLGCNVALSDSGSRRLLESRLQFTLRLTPACKALGNDKQRGRILGCLDSCQSTLWSGLAGLAVASASTP